MTGSSTSPQPSGSAREGALIDCEEQFSLLCVSKGDAISGQQKDASLLSSSSAEKQRRFFNDAHDNKENEKPDATEGQAENETSSLSSCFQYSPCSSQGSLDSTFAADMFLEEAGAESKKARLHLGRSVVVQDVSTIKHLDLQPRNTKDDASGSSHLEGENKCPPPPPQLRFPSPPAILLARSSSPLFGAGKGDVLRDVPVPNENISSSSDKSRVWRAIKGVRPRSMRSPDLAHNQKTKRPRAPRSKCLLSKRVCSAFTDVSNTLPRPATLSLKSEPVQFTKMVSSCGSSPVLKTPLIKPTPGGLRYSSQEFAPSACPPLHAENFGIHNAGKSMFKPLHPGDIDLEVHTTCTGDELDEDSEVHHANMAALSMPRLAIAQNTTNMFIESNSYQTPAPEREGESATTEAPLLLPSLDTAECAAAFTGGSSCSIASEVSRLSKEICAWKCKDMSVPPRQAGSIAKAQTVELDHTYSGIKAESESEKHSLPIGDVYNASLSSPCFSPTWDAAGSPIIDVSMRHTRRVVTYRTEIEKKSGGQGVEKIRTGYQRRRMSIGRTDKILPLDS